MKNPGFYTYGSSGILEEQEVRATSLIDHAPSARAFKELEQAVQSALETYSNVHRGTGQFSMISTALFEHARDIILEYFGLGKQKYMVVFCSAYSSEIFKKHLAPGSFRMISSMDIGLPLGLRALAIRKSALPKGAPFQTGGSVARMVSPKYIIWADGPQKFEPGTPPIINAIAFAAALILRARHGQDCFRINGHNAMSVKEILYKDDVNGYIGEQLMYKLEKLPVGKDVPVPTSDGEKRYINFDNAASTPTFFPIWNVVRKAWQQSHGIHADIVNEVRKNLADFLDASQDIYDVFFTGNATESINIIARLFQNEYKNDPECVILNTMLEHNSNELPWRYIPGASLIRLSIDKDGFVNMEELESVLRKYNHEGLYGKKRIRLLTISGASNVLGTFNDLKAVSTIAHKYGARVLVDAAQMVAHRAVYMENWDIDYLVFSGHKIYAPFGSGALVIKRSLIPSFNDDLELVRASGEENIIGIAAIGKAISLLHRIGMDVIEEKERLLVSRVLKGLSEIKDLKVYGISDPDPGKLLQKGSIVSFGLKKMQHQQAARALAEQGGIGIRYGCFCTHLLIKHLLGLTPTIALLQNTAITLVPRISNIIPGMMRVSFGIENEVNEVDRFIGLLKKILNAPSIPVDKSAKKRAEGLCKVRLQKAYPQH